MREKKMTLLSKNNHFLIKSDLFLPKENLKNVQNKLDDVRSEIQEIKNNPLYLKLLTLQEEEKKYKEKIIFLKFINIFFGDKNALICQLSLFFDDKDKINLIKVHPRIRGFIRFLLFNNWYNSSDIPCDNSQILHQMVTNYDINFIDPDYITYFLDELKMFSSPNLKKIRFQGFFNFLRGIQNPNTQIILKTICDEPDFEIQNSAGEEENHYNDENREEKENDPDIKIIQTWTIQDIIDIISDNKTVETIELTNELINHNNIKFLTQILRIPTIKNIVFSNIKCKDFDFNFEEVFKNKKIKLSLLGFSQISLLYFFQNINFIEDLELNIIKFSIKFEPRTNIKTNNLKINILDTSREIPSTIDFFKNISTINLHIDLANYHPINLNYMNSIIQNLVQIEGLQNFICEILSIETSFDELSKLCIDNIPLQTIIIKDRNKKRKDIVINKKINKN